LTRRRVLAAYTATLFMWIASCSKQATVQPSQSSTGFSGVLRPQAAVWHYFSVYGAGRIKVTLARLEGPGDVGIGIGLWQAGCQRLTWTDHVETGVSLSWNTESEGAYCVLIYDSGGQGSRGRLSESASYTLAVVHP
jgi:hypothetical protein